MNKSKMKKELLALSALADKSRLYVILILLTKGSQYVGQMIKALRIEPTLLSHHLSVLKEAGLVASARHGKKVLYHIPSNIKVSGRHPGVRVGRSTVHFKRED